MAVTIQNERLREGELRFALQLAVMGAFLVGISVAVFLGVRWGEPLDAQDWWGLAATVVLVSLLPLVLYIAASPQLLRLDESTIRSVTFRCGRRRRITIQWSDVEQCALGVRGAGIAAHGQRLWPGGLTKEDGEFLRAEVEARLAPYFDFDAPTRYDLRRQRQRAWSIRRKSLDKLALLGVGASVCGIYLGLLIVWLVWWPVSIVVCAPVGIAVLVAVLRNAQRWKYERWHERRVEPAG